MDATSLRKLYHEEDESRGGGDAKAAGGAAKAGGVAAACCCGCCSSFCRPRPPKPPQPKPINCLSLFFLCCLPRKQLQQAIVESVRQESVRQESVRQESQQAGVRLTTLAALEQLLFEERSL